MNRGLLPLRTLVLAVILAVPAACEHGGAEPLWVALGLADPVPPPPEHVVILCDNSPGSTCARPALAQVLDASLRHLAARPGSTLRLYALGSAVADTRLLAKDSIRAAPTTRQRDARAFHQSQSGAQRAAFQRAAEPYLEHGPATTSPLIESISKITALEHVNHLVIVSDALEQSQLGRWECGELPSPADLVRHLKAESLLLPKSISGTVTFAFRTLGRIDSNRCPLSLARVRHIDALWTTSLTAAGAMRVSFTPEAPDFATEDSVLARGGAR